MPWEHRYLLITPRTPPCREQLGLGSSGSLADLAAGDAYLGPGGAADYHPHQRRQHGASPLSAAASGGVSSSPLAGALNVARSPSLLAAAGGGDYGAAEYADPYLAPPPELSGALAGAGATPHPNRNPNPNPHPHPNPNPNPNPNPAPPG